MHELISPQQSETAVLIASAILAVGGALWGSRVLGARGLLAGLVGPLIFGLWQFHKWITRYDPRSEYFGLDNVWVLLLEVALFVIFGAIAGVVLGKILKLRMTTDQYE